MTAAEKRLRPKKYSEIAEVIRERVSSGEYKELLPGINVLSEEFEVNRKTANRAILHLVKEGLLVRRAGFGTFVTGTEDNVETAPMKRVNSKRYAVLIRSLDPFPGYLELLSGCDEVIAAIGGSVIYTKFDEHDPDSLLGRLRFQQIEGVIVCGIIENPLLKKLQQEFSVLLIDSTPDVVPANAIVWDYYDASFKLVEKLANSGKERLAIIDFISDPTPNHTKTSWPLRRQGFEDAAEKNGMEYEVFQYEWSLSGVKPGCPLDGFLRKVPEGTALVSFIIPTLLNRLQSHDLIGKIAIAGFGDKISIRENALAGVYISEDYHIMGKRAGETIIDVLGRPRSQLQTEILKGEIIQK